MLYYLFDYLDRVYKLAGAGVFQYISFRASMAMLASLVIAFFFGKALIEFLRRKQIGESIRDLGLHGQMEKKGTPTMGGIIILACVLIPTLLFAKLTNVYIILLIVSSVWMGMIGFLDDYIKVFKKNKEGLHGRFKIVGQVGLGLIVGLVLYFNDSVVVRQYQYSASEQNVEVKVPIGYTEVKAHTTTIPFVKNNELNYNQFFDIFGEEYSWIFYVAICILVVTAVSNGANMTDGIDGLAAGSSAIIAFTLAIFAYLSGNVIFSTYLKIMYIPESGEMVIFAFALIGACVGFLWYNSYPAQVFMGDTGSLALGGIIAVLALSVRKELILPVLCGVFLVENLSVILQVAYFKYQKRKRGIEYARENRLFKMAPLHHHYQKMGFHEAKIVTRFFIVGISLAILTLVTLKLR